MNTAIRITTITIPSGHGYVPGNFVRVNGEWFDMGLI